MYRNAAPRLECGLRVGDRVIRCRQRACLRNRGATELSLLAYLESTAFADWVLISMLGFPTLIAFHSVGMGVVVGLTLIAALRLNGVLAGMNAALIPRVLTVAVYGFWLNLVTGLALFVSRGTDYISSTIFLLKMFLVIVSAAILFRLRRRVGAAAAFDDGKHADGTTRRLAVVVSVTWFGAVATGRLIAYLSDLY